MPTRLAIAVAFATLLAACGGGTTTTTVGSPGGPGASVAGVSTPSQISVVTPVE